MLLATVAFQTHLLPIKILFKIHLLLTKEQICRHYKQQNINFEYNFEYVHPRCVLTMVYGIITIKHNNICRPR
jgi:hypothetical protein